MKHFFLVAITTLFYSGLLPVLADVSASNFRLSGPDGGKVVLSWNISGSVGGFNSFFYLNGTYNAAVSRGTSASQSPQSRTLVKGTNEGAYMQQTGNSGSVTDAPPPGQTYYYWLHYSAYSIIDDSENFFACYLGGAYSSILNTTCIGPISVYVPDSEVKVSFDPNEGEGTMEAQDFTPGTAQKLKKNVFTRKEFVFSGWSTTRNGAVEYEDEAELTTDVEMTLYAVWTSPALTLSAESADWSSGSITLQCEDADTSGATHRYTLWYYDEGKSDWVEVEGAKDIAGDADGNAHLTDDGFSTRLGGIPPVRYRASDENERISEECVARNKYGIYVSPGGYAPSMGLEPYPSATPNYASEFARLSGGTGAFAQVHELTGAKAIYKEIDDAFKEVAAQIEPGDECFLYFGTHGGVSANKTSTTLALYNGYYTEEQLASHVQSLNAVSSQNEKGRGVAVVGFVHACHSKGIADNSADDQYCRVGSWCVNAALTSRDTAWVTATDDPTALSKGDYFSLFLLSYGWGKGWAGETGSALSCKKLADYTKDRCDTLFDGIKFRDDGNEYEVKVGISDSASILGNIFIGKCGSHTNQARPTNPVLTVKGTDTETITLEISNVFDADSVVLFTQRGPSETYDSVHFQNVNGSFTYPDRNVATSGRECPYSYLVRTMNGAGIGKSNEVTAWRVHTETHRVAFYYAVPQDISVSSSGYYWNLPYDSTLSEIWEQLDAKVKELGVKGYVHTGWYTERKGKGRKISPDDRVLVDIDYYAGWTAMTKEWLDKHPQIAAESGGDVATAANRTAANGCRTVGDCYTLGINPEDPNDDFRITSFRMDGAKPIITVNHTEDGSGESLLPRMKTLGKSELSGEWEEVPEEGNPAHRFFTVTVEAP